jgi:hypothetical protein
LQKGQREQIAFDRRKTKRANNGRLPQAQKFPAPSLKFPARAEKFPAPMSREFAPKQLMLLVF